MENKIKPVGSPPRGWHMKKEFIDEKGNVFEKGKFLYNEWEVYEKVDIDEVPPTTIDEPVEEDVVDVPLSEELPTESAEDIAERELLEKVSKLRKRIAELRIERENKQKMWDYSKPWEEYVELQGVIIYGGLALTGVSIFAIACAYALEQGYNPLTGLPLP